MSSLSPSNFRIEFAPQFAPRSPPPLRSPNPSQIARQKNLQMQFIDERMHLEQARLDRQLQIDLDLMREDSRFHLEELCRDNDKETARKLHLIQRAYKEVLRDHQKRHNDEVKRQEALAVHLLRTYHLELDAEHRAWVRNSWWLTWMGPRPGVEEWRLRLRPEYIPRSMEIRLSTTVAEMCPIIYSLTVSTNVSPATAEQISGSENGASP